MVKVVIKVDSSVVILVEVVRSCEMSGSNNTCGSISSNRVVVEVIIEEVFVVVVFLFVINGNTSKGSKQSL